MKPDKVREIVTNVMKMVKAGMDEIQIDAYVDGILKNSKDGMPCYDDCDKCSDLIKSRTKHVPGEGSLKARIMFVGEGPGAVEDELGRPFVGPAGQLLDKILEASEWKREEVYITNVIHCRPEHNRAPSITEVANCMPNLKQEIEHINPDVIICLGSVAANALIHPDFKITKEHGKWFQDDKGRKIMAMFHPAFILRKTGDEEKLAKRMVWQAIQEIKKLLEETRV